MFCFIVFVFGAVNLVLKAFHKEGLNTQSECSEWCSHVHVVISTPRGLSEFEFKEVILLSTITPVQGLTHTYMPHD